MILTFVCICLWTSCDKIRVEVTPNNITVDCQAQDLVFHSNVKYSYIDMVLNETDSPEFTRIVEDWFMTISGEWFKIEGQLHSMDNKDIKVHLDENKGTTRQLTFSVNRREFNEYVTIVQSGASDTQRTN